MRLLRRPRAGILVLFALVILITIAKFKVQMPTTILSTLWSALRESPYYSEGPSKYYSWRTPSFFPPLKGRHGKSPNDFCAGFPTYLLDSIQIVLKTGAGESAKTRAHITTVTSCITNLLIFSDLEEDIGDQHVMDILADLPESYKNHSDFATYSIQKQTYSEGRPVGYSSDGWKLDRFKFLPMADKAYQMRPQAQWYVFIEVDVYYFWDTLFRLLNQLDPYRMHYLGSPAPGRDGIYFAYGGAGFVLSRGLMERLVQDPTPFSVRYEDYAKNDCCGDAALGYAIMNQTGERLQALYPTFAGDELVSLKVDQETWCVPLLALHRVSPEQLSSLWEWERTRPYNEYPFTYSTIVDYTFSSLYHSPIRTSWDNYAGDAQPEGSTAHGSILACGSACGSDPGCLQYLYSAGVCKFGAFFQMGRSKPNLDVTSGWDMGKLARLGYKEDPETSSSCKEATWLKPVVR